MNIVVVRIISDPFLWQNIKVRRSHAMSCGTRFRESEIRIRFIATNVRRNEKVVKNLQVDSKGYGESWLHANFVV